MKHRLKLLVRSAYARLLYHTGLCALVDRLMPRRLTILAGHCVHAPSNARLPKDMKVTEQQLESLLAGLARRYEITTVGQAWHRLKSPGRQSFVALSMDDGYRDNHTHLVPLLERLGLSATIYLESAPLDERRVNWTHKFFFALEKLGARRFVERYAALCEAEHARTFERVLAGRREPSSYELKRLLKYELPAAERTRAVELVFREAGGDERALCDELYLTWDEVRELARHGLELGGHTLHHEILARLDPPGAEREVAGCRAALERGLGTRVESFAYPFGRRWDFDAASKAAARTAGFATAASTHAGTNSSSSDPYELRRLMIDEDLQPHLIATEACGGFDLLRKLGLDLSE